MGAIHKYVRHGTFILLNYVSFMRAYVTTLFTIYFIRLSSTEANAMHSMCYNSKYVNTKHICESSFELLRIS